MPLRHQLKNVYIDKCQMSIIDFLQTPQVKILCRGQHHYMAYSPASLHQQVCMMPLIIS